MSYRKKNIFLVLIFIIVVVYAFTGPIQKTISIRNENAFLQGSVQSMDENLIKIRGINLQLSEFDSLLNSNPGATQNNLLEEVGQLSHQNNVTVKSLADPERNSNKIFEIETFTITLEGTYKSLVKVIFALEKKSYLGRITSADFKLSSDDPQKRKSLYCTLHIQKYNPK